MAQTPSGGNRREFLKTSSAVAAAGTLVGTGMFASHVHAAGSDILKIGLVGCGGRGTGAARDALEAEPNVKLTAMGDVHEDRLNGSYNNLSKAESIKDRVDVPQDRRFAGFDAIDKVLATGVDILILATPPGFRPAHFEAAVKKGVHVFMEKPVAVDGPGVRKVIAAAKLAKEQNLAVGVGLQRRHEKKYIETIQRLQDGAIGDIISMRTYWNGAGVWVNPRKEGQTEMQYQLRNWYYFTWLSGDHIVEQHIHNLDVANWLKNGYPVRCLGMGGREVRIQEQYGEIFDHFACEYEYADGSRNFSQCRHIANCWSSVSEHAHGSKGNVDIGGGNISVKGGEGWRYRGKGDPNPYRQEHADLIASIRAGKPINEGEYGAYSSLTAIMGRMATYSGKQVTWDEALNSSLALGPTEFTWDAPVPPAVIAVPGQTKAF